MECTTQPITEFTNQDGVFVSNALSFPIASGATVNVTTGLFLGAVSGGPTITFKSSDTTLGSSGTLATCEATGTANGQTSVGLQFPADGTQQITADEPTTITFWAESTVDLSNMGGATALLFVQSVTG